MNTAHQNKKGIVEVVVLLVIVLALAAGGYLYLNNRSGSENLGTLPPVSERINAEPTSGYKMEVGEVTPGKALTVGSLSLQTDAYVVVIKNIKDSAPIGKSTMLTAGEHSNVVVNLTSQIVDGDVVYIKLQNEDGEYIQSSAEADIEVMKPVGMIMAHYEDEY